jgi:aconitase A
VRGDWFRFVAAVYALYDYGVRCVIAPSFGDIFAGNAVQNGLLTAVVTDNEAAASALQCSRPMTGSSGRGRCRASNYKLHSLAISA